MKILITGGAGFIGSAVVRQSLNGSDDAIVNVDKLTYAGNLESLPGANQHARYSFELADICDADEVTRIFREHKPDAVMHLAAESHVDRSIDAPLDFIQTNVAGTCVLLDRATRYWRGLDDSSKGRFRFLHVSTDEVYGDLDSERPPFSEASNYAPSSPYAASKAGADFLVRAWHRTFGLPTVVSNCSNNYGPYQFPEKLIPLVVLNALEGRQLPLYGDGTQVRDWLYVDDHACALRLLLRRGRIGETYNVGGSNERTNLSIVQSICMLLEELAPVKPQGVSAYSDLIAFVADRPGHDRRYAIDSTKLTEELGWKPLETFESGLRKTVQWCIENRAWFDNVQSGRYQRERLGLWTEGEPG